MQEHGMYFGKQDFYNTIRMNGGAWNDSKERPLVCVMKSIENEHLYWAIPVGDWSHRTKEAQDFLHQPKRAMKNFPSSFTAHKYSKF